MTRVELESKLRKYRRMFDEAQASPEDRHRVDVLGQLGRTWGTR